jgi:hypothetical protein
MSPQIGEKSIAAQAWEPGLEGAISGPFRAVVFVELNKVGWIRDVYKCRHRHATAREALACPTAAKRRI